MAEGVVIKVGLDGTKVTQSLKAIKNTVAASTSQWKAEFQIFKNAGDQLGMLGAKYDGLSRTIKIQDVQVKKLTESYNKAIEKYGKILKRQCGLLIKSTIQPGDRRFTVKN